jgi:hypothetical protein
MHPPTLHLKLNCALQDSSPYCTKYNHLQSCRDVKQPYNLVEAHSVSITVMWMWMHLMKQMYVWAICVRHELFNKSCEREIVGWRGRKSVATHRGSCAGTQTGALAEIKRTESSIHSPTHPSIHYFHPFEGPKPWAHFTWAWGWVRAKLAKTTNSPPTHHWTIPTNMGHFYSWFSQWEPLVVTIHLLVFHSFEGPKPWAHFTWAWGWVRAKLAKTTNNPPTHHWTTPTSRGHFYSWFSQWEPLVVTNVGTHRSLVARPHQ